MKFKTYEKIMKVLLITILIFGVLLIIKVSEKRDQKIMETDYCFQEKADSSLYHYVCEE